MIFLFFFFQFLENCQADTCTRNGILRRGKYLKSNNAKYQFFLRENGNLVLTCNGRPLWSSNTVNDNVDYLYLNKDGSSLILVGKDGRSVWKEKTWGDALRMVLQDDGDLVLYNKCNVSVWNTGTYRKCEKGADHFFPQNFFYFLILPLNLKSYFNIQHSSSNNLLFIRKGTLPSASSNELGQKRVTNSRSVLQCINSKLLTGLQSIHFK